MATLVTKSLISLGSIGSLVGGTYLAKSYMFPKGKSMEAALKEEKWEILSQSGKDSEWEEIYNQYKTKELTDEYRFDGKISKDEDKSTGLQKLKSSCKAALTKEFSESLYKKITKWCVIPISAADRLTKLGNYKKINVVATDTTTDNSTWTSREVLFKKNLSSNNAYLGINLPAQVAGSGDQIAENIKLLKAGCETHMNKKNYDYDFEGSMKKTQDWCGK